MTMSGLLASKDEKIDKSALSIKIYNAIDWITTKIKPFFAVKYLYLFQKTIS